MFDLKYLAFLSPSKRNPTRSAFFVTGLNIATLEASNGASKTIIPPVCPILGLAFFTISAALINPFEKLKSNQIEKLIIKKENSNEIRAQIIGARIDSIRNKENQKKIVSLKNEFAKAKIEEYNFSKLKVYLNAPAMSGLSTFKAPDLKDSLKVFWTIGFNNTDKVLHKTFGPIRFGDQNGDTRLGGNWENEAWKTKDQLRKYKLGDRFKFVESGVQVDLFGHDFFCYLNQPLFQKHLKDFITEK